MTNFFSFLFYCVWPNLSLTSQSRAAHKTGKKSFFVWSRFTFITRHSRKKIRKRWQSVRSFELFQKGEFLSFVFVSMGAREQQQKKRLETKETHTSVHRTEMFDVFPAVYWDDGEKKKEPRASCVLRERTARTSTGDWSLFQVTRCLTYI
jgi:hypothetical protein